jgi:hypothetical protein
MKRVAEQRHGHEPRDRCSLGGQSANCIALVSPPIGRYLCANSEPNAPALTILKLAQPKLNLWAAISWC